MDAILEASRLGRLQVELSKKSQTKAQVVSNTGKRLTISISLQAKDALD